MIKIKIDMKKLEKYKGFIYDLYLKEIFENLPKCKNLNLENLYSSRLTRKLLHDKCRQFIEISMRKSDRDYIEAMIAKNNFDFEPKIHDGLVYGEILIEEIK